MRHSAKSRGRRGPTLLLVMAVVAVALLLPAAALAATPTVTIVGPYGINTSATPPPTAAAPAVDDSYVTLYVNDNAWGSTQMRVSNDGGVTWWDTYSASQYSDGYMYYELYGGVIDPVLRLDGMHTVTAQFSNDSGVTWGPTASATTMVDTQSPVVDAPEGYWNNNYPYALSVHDQIGLSGVAQLWYRVDAGTPTTLKNASPFGTSNPLETSFALSGATGTRHTIDYVAVDYAGNPSGYYNNTRGARAAVRSLGRSPFISGGYSSYVVIDRTAPTTTARGVSKNWHVGPETISFSATDGGMAGVAYIEYSITRSTATKPADWTTGDAAVVTLPGEDKVWYRGVDAALPQGNVEAARSVLVKITPTLGPKTEAKAVKASAGKAFDLRYKVSDSYSPKAKSVTILIKDAWGTVVKTIDLGTRSLGKWHSVSCTLGTAGAYKYVVHAKDTAGLAQRNPAGNAKITVK